MRRIFIRGPPHRTAMPDVLRLGQGEPAPARIAVVGCGGAGCNVLPPVPPGLGGTRVALNDAPPRSMAGVVSRLVLARGAPPGVAARGVPAGNKRTPPAWRG